MATIKSIHKPLYTSPKRYIYEKGGRGSGKSFAVTDYGLRITYDKGRVILFMRYTMIAASISIIPEFEAAMERENALNDFDIIGSEIINKFTRSKIIFKGVKASSLNQTANLKSIQGLTDVIYDEFEEHPDQESFDKLDDSIREAGVTNKIVLVSNALHKKSWQRQQFWKKTGLYYTMTERIMSTFKDNRKNLSDSWHEKRKLVKKRSKVKYDREYLGLDYEDVEDALWCMAMILRVSELPPMQRIVVAIDPAATAKDTSDDTGIIVAGLGVDGRGYVLEDSTGKYSPNGWAKIAIDLYHKWKADRIIGEKNNGGDMIKTIIHNIDKSVSYKAVWASRGKMTRAEPIASLYEEEEVSHLGTLLELETEMTTWAALAGQKSPNRVDALVWGLTELMLNQREGFQSR